MQVRQAFHDHERNSYNRIYLQPSRTRFARMHTHESRLCHVGG